MLNQKLLFFNIKIRILALISVANSHFLLVNLRELGHKLKLAVTDQPFLGGSRYPCEFDGLKNDVIHDSKLKFKELLNDAVGNKKKSKTIIFLTELRSENSRFAADSA
jgi:hypothetical protein